MPDQLETVDLLGVEILAAGGPVFGVGSPPEGDFWTADDLRAMAQAAQELAGEITPPSKIGHSDAQALLENSGFKRPTPGEMPAAGWLENIRVNDDGSRLLADIKAVPKKVAELIEAGAYRTRSVELSKVTSQVTSKVYDWVVTGLAWLGGKMPAVHTLDDVAALYEAAGLETPDARVFVVYAAGDIVWAPDDGMSALRAAVSEALNGASDPMVAERFWVRDVADGKALVEDWMADGDERTAWVVPFTRNADGEVEVADRDGWVEAREAWVEAVSENERRLAEIESGFSQGRADSRPGMPTYSDEQRRKFAEATGLEADKVTDAILAAAGVPEETDEPDRDLEQAGEQIRSLEAKVEAADKRTRDLEEQLRVEKRASFVEAALRDGRVEPGQHEQLEKLYDADAEAARTFVAALKPNDDLAREYGKTEGEEPAEGEAGELDREFEAYLARTIGVPAEELI